MSAQTAQRCFIFVEAGAAQLLPATLAITTSVKTTVVTAADRSNSARRQALWPVETKEASDAIVLVGSLPAERDARAQEAARIALCRSLLRRSAGGQLGSLTFVLAANCQQDLANEVWGLVDALLNQFRCVGVRVHFVGADASAAFAA